MARLSEKIDDLKVTKVAASDYEGDENSSPSHDGGRDDITTGDKSGNEDEEGDSEEDEVGEQMFVDHTYYRHKIVEGFAQRQPSDLASSKPAYFNIDDQVARTLEDSKFAAKRQDNSITVANAFFAAVRLLTRRGSMLLKRVKPGTTRQPTSFSSKSRTT